ncbi:pullulanase-type alpha-1,6-glucosidase [Aliiglaciecola sp. LCG003]|uniref:pullulanase-type alpha-1,6-glucosidase n=1 Tax=Aliiglaciecola sp. LCG003 TaxID=3053655 RepID=UPI0025746263|nr:pullulanase-type alpha-1,6-glucosidase [Aliiglaciecola sp. LCG003]WJG10391.1 pullulanase-type alpha-1,6-glucosidase [Aliiglaciecola sp. LCG003]
MTSMIKIPLLFAATLLSLSGCKNTQVEHRTGSINLAIPISLSQQDMAAHWLTPSLLVSPHKLDNPKLLVQAQGRIDDSGQIDQHLLLQPSPLPSWVATQYPHLKGFYAYQFTQANERESVKAILKQQVALLGQIADTKQTQLSWVQSAKLIDWLYTSSGDDADEVTDYGAVVSGEQTQFTLWAPTARKVTLRLFSQNKLPLEHGIIPLVEDTHSGVWRVSTGRASHGTYYQYEIEVYHPATQKIETLLVTDPYSLGLSTNSVYSQVVDLNHVDTQPADWQQHKVPQVSAAEKLVIYETHIRDFSAADQTLTDPAVAGKYAAFSQTHSASITHLKALKAAGLNTIHLLPSYDISTVDERTDRVIGLQDSLQAICAKVDLTFCQQNYDPAITLQQLLQSFATQSPDAQAVVEQIRALDGFNWGYDPYHYTVPEGSYALNPEGVSRIVEFRAMVQRLHQLGFRVIMDVVYNHTYAAGIADKSVLDKIVPNYYHRLHPISGNIEQSTCCNNTATEHNMMAKLMTDSLVVWAKDYKIDGFRFDLMGHQPKSVMHSARAAVQAVDPDTYFYGEGWNFGEVANNAQFIQASQLELAGTEIGTFTDRLRDAIRGGSSFVSADDIRRGQGLGNGLYTQPNELQSSLTPQQIKAEYLLSMDQARIGLVANLADYPLENAAGAQVFGRDIDYGGAPTGYALDPADSINYVSKHDNQTLWDNNQYRIANEVSTDERVRMQILSLAYPLMAQGIPFIHMGSELLRSKSFLRDSYDYGDWFNQVDFSKQTNNYNVGLPPADKDQQNWPLITRLLEQNGGRDQVKPEHIQQAAEMFMDLLFIRTSSPLFSLTSDEQIIQRIKFHNTGPDQQPGLIVMSMDDTGAQSLDKTYSKLLVVFNNSAQARSFEFAGAEQYRLHPRQSSGADDVVKRSRTSPNNITVSPLTVAVFVQ